MQARHAAAEAPIPYIDAATIRGATPMRPLIAALREAFAQAGHDAGPERQAFGLQDDVSLLVMPALGVGAAGVKIVTVNPEARPAVTGIFLLIDGTDGRPLALLDATMLTPRRTAAASALASGLLARKDARTLLMVGTGTLSHHLVEAHSAVRDLDKVLIWGRSADRAAAVADELRASGFPASSISNLDRAVGEADIISVATLSTAPLIKGDLLKPGTHVDLVGAFKPTMCEADPQCFARAQVFVDTREGALTEAGDLLQAIDRGYFRADAIAADLAELCAGNGNWRTGDSTITLFKSVGAAIEDLAAARFIARETGHLEA
ncbi:ornithine cyclodeaminase family protein [Sphingopyxis sp. J-6]|uniref:ornithine cyclodeaminase family protein n=1 Tax=Sphingopyxis sp. J-6 TaxID=3122054 RepID=UPI003984213C